MTAESYQLHRCSRRCSLRILRSIALESIFLTCQKARTGSRATVENDRVTFARSVRESPSPGENPRSIVFPAPRENPPAFRAGVHFAHLPGGTSFPAFPLPGRFSAPEENERDTRRERREKQYADLTLLVTFVGHCTSHQIARVLLHSRFRCRSVDGAYQNRHCAGGRG